MLNDLSPRLQSMRMTLLKYGFEAEYIPGKQLIDADAFSRAPLEFTADDFPDIANQANKHINTVIEQIHVSNERIEEIKRNTKIDSVLSKVRLSIEQGWPNSKNECDTDIKPYWEHRQDLTHVGGLILRGQQIVIPSIMRKDMLSRIHEGHLGVEKCKRRARNSCFWPGMNNAIQQIVAKCQSCLEMQPSKSKIPLKPIGVSQKPWEKIGTDLFQHGNRNFLIIVDYYSGWPELYELPNTRASEVIQGTKEAFARHGVPEVVISECDQNVIMRMGWQNQQ